MKNKILIILIAGALNAPTLTQAQSNQRGQGQQQRGQGQQQRGQGQQQRGQGQQQRGQGQQQRGQGQQQRGQGQQQRGQGQQQRGQSAPNSVRGQSGQGNSVNRQSVRQPLSNGNNGQQRNSGQTRNSEQGGRQSGQSGRKPQSGMSRTENGGQQQRERVNIKETLDLTDEQASQLRAIHEKWHKIAKAIHSNKELSKEEKKAKLKEAFEEMDAAVRELLSEEQYAKLVKLRRSNARPNQNGGGNSSGRPQSQQGGREQGGRSQGGRSQGGRSQGGRSQGGREQGGRSQGGRSQGGRSQGGRGER